MSQPVCIITGASRGIGLATALRFARSGHALVLAARDARRLEEASRQVQSLRAACEALPVDLADASAGRELVEVALRRFGRVDVLVNNAGAAPCAAFERFTDEQFEQAVSVNIAGTYRVTRAAWPVMLDQQRGTIVSISSMAAVDPFPGLGVYGACKAWVNTFTKALAEEGRPHGVRVFAVAPGAVETEMLRGAFPDFPAEQTLSPDEVAAVIESCCEPRMSCATGQTIYVRK